LTGLAGLRAAARRAAAIAMPHHRFNSSGSSKAVSGMRQ
jgi:hypothetical protein